MNRDSDQSWRWKPNEFLKKKKVGNKKQCQHEKLNDEKKITPIKKKNVVDAKSGSQIFNCCDG